MKFKHDLLRISIFALIINFKFIMQSESDIF